MLCALGNAQCKTNLKNQSDRLKHEYHWASEVAFNVRHLYGCWLDYNGFYLSQCMPASSLVQKTRLTFIARLENV